MTRKQYKTMLTFIKPFRLLPEYSRLTPQKQTKAILRDTKAVPFLKLTLKRMLRNAK